VRIYFAGPDVFRLNYGDLVAEIRRLCAERGATPLVPADEGQKDPQAIYDKNIRLIREADCVIANLDPFRGPAEPDSGTVFEVGFAKALGKRVVIRLSDGRSYREKLAGTPFAPATGSMLAADGTFVEGFGLPLNIMPFFAADATAGSLAEAVDRALELAAVARPGGTGEPSCGGAPGQDGPAPGTRGRIPAAAGPAGFLEP
jgi:nucleoside 2-deoxyribosyltransferase